MMPRSLRITGCVLILLLTGCASLAPLLASPTPVPAPQASVTPEPIPTPTLPGTTSQPRLLRLWLPPQFDPNAGTPAAELLKTRLLDFQMEYPAIQVEVRIKSETDILKTLSVTINAAPDAMPDLIALSYANMQAAASAGFLHPFEGLTSVLQDPDWYAFARELGHYQNTEYGIPFACDVLLASYRPAAFTEKPGAWEAIFDSDARMVFPVSDPNALFPLSLYLSANGQLVDEQGIVTLEEDALIRLLAFYEQAIETGAALPFTKEYQTDLQALQFYLGGGAEIAVIRATSDIHSPSGEYHPLLGLNNTPYALGDGWLLALAGSSTENQPLAVELASYLVDSNYMSQWTRASGYLPVRPQALNGWEDEAVRTPLDEILQSAHPVPPVTVTAALGPLLQGALIRVFDGEQPEVVARSVLESLK